MSFTQGAPTQPLSIVASNVFLTASSAGGNAFTVRQLGVGNIASFQTSSGSSALFINPSGQIGIGTTSPTTTLTVTGGIYYTDDVFKRGPYILPTPSNAATIQAWISATCNAASQPSRSWWATSQAPVYGNVATGPVSGGTNYQGGILLPDGRVLFCPNGQSNVGIFNPFTNLYSAIKPSGAQSSVQGSPVLLPNGNVLFVPQTTTANIATYNPATLTLSNSFLPGANFVGAVLDPTGNVTMMPYSVNSNVGTYNPVLNTYSNIVRVGNDGVIYGAVLLPNGNVVGVPATNSNIIQYNPLTNPPTVSNSFNLGGSGTGKFFGGVLAPNGNVIMIPNSGVATSNVGVFNPTTLAYSNIITNTGTTAFVGGVLLPTGNVIMAPLNTSNIGMFDTVSLTYSNCALTGTTNGFTGATLLPDGRVVFVPYNSANVGVLSTFTPAPVEFCKAPYFNKY